MAKDDDLELTSEVNADEPEERQPDLSPEAKTSWDRALEKRGLTPREEAGAEQQPERQPAKRTRQQPDTTQLPPARGHRERLETRKTNAELRAEMEELKGLVRSLLPKDPEIDPDSDPTGYTKDLIKKAALEALGGEEITGFLKELREERVAQREQFEMAQRERAFYDGWADEMVDFEQVYERDHPELAKGYRQRLGHFFQASVKMQRSLGLPQADAETEALRGLIALTDRALSRNILPPAFLDAMFRQASANGGNNGHDPAKDRQRAENRETAERRKAAGATSSLSTTRATPTPSPDGHMAAAAEDAPTGRGRAAALKEAAKKSGQDPRRALKQMGAR